MMKNLTTGFTFADYVLKVTTPRAFFTEQWEVTPESMFMAYLKFASLFHPKSSPTLFRDLLVDCTVIHAYYLEHGARFYRHHKEEWPTHHVPRVLDHAAEIAADPKLKEAIDTLVIDWLKLCDEALYKLLYTERNEHLKTRNHIFRALSCLLAFTAAVLIIFAVEYIKTTLAPAFIAPASLVALLLCFTLSQSFKPSIKAADLISKQEATSETFDEAYDHSEKIFDLKRSVVDSFSQGETSYPLNEPFVEKVIAISYPKTDTAQPERESTKRAMLVLAEDMLKQRYEYKYSYHHGYYYSKDKQHKDQTLSPSGEGPPHYDQYKYSPR